MAVGADGGFGARLAALFAGVGPALVVRDGALRAARAFTAAQAHERVESGTRIAIAAGASIGAGTRIELLGGAVSIGAGARIGEGVVLNVEGQGAHARVQVNFESAGTKWLMMQFANLEPVR
jgi:UDP-3-O-[3-hydroxymyristoyl] glucosamine N-acyltransferase